MRLATNEVTGFLSQSNISKKNIVRLEQLANIQDFEFQRLRLYILEIARLHPRKKRRWTNLSRIAPHLFEALVESEYFDEWIDEMQSSIGNPCYLDDLERGDLLANKSLVFLNRYLQDLAQEASESELEYNTSLEPD